MSEKQQHTAARLQKQMQTRYGDGYHHKHNKYHITYRMHYRSHPVLLLEESTEQHDQEKDINASTGLLHHLKLRQIRKRLDKGRIH